MGRMLDHLGQACARERERAGLRQIDIATAADVSHVTIHRFETPGGGTPRDLDTVVDAYAHECNLRPTDLWQLALDAWRSSEPPS